MCTSTHCSLFSLRDEHNGRFGLFINAANTSAKRFSHSFCIFWRISLLYNKVKTFAFGPLNIRNRKPISLSFFSSLRSHKLHVFSFNRNSYGEKCVSELQKKENNNKRMEKCGNVVGRQHHSPISLLPTHCSSEERKKFSWISFTHSDSSLVLLVYNNQQKQTCSQKRPEQWIRWSEPPNTLSIASSSSPSHASLFVFRKKCQNCEIHFMY